LEIIFVFYCYALQNKAYKIKKRNNCVFPNYYSLGIDWASFIAFLSPSI
jgi:hypothetical protein